jgi:hypothetical protein
MGICVFLCIQKLQRVDTGAITPPPPSPPRSAPPAPLPPSASLDEVEDLEKLLAKTKKVTELKRQLAEAQALLEDPLPPSRSTWNSLF